MRLLLAFLAALLLHTQADAADTVPERPGWVVHNTSMTYAELIDALKPAIKAEGMGLVTQAGPTGAAKNRGITIPGSRIFGVFNNKFAVRAIRTSISAMIEAPVRMYVTENPDGTGTLSYKTPTMVFSPYFEEGGDELRTVASELDAVFEAIAVRALGS